MELVEGKDLRALMDTGPLPVAVAVHVVAEVLRALAFAHALTDEAGPCGVVHRDVTPHNILLSWHGEVKLSDFGIARALRRDPAEVSRALRGKPPYMAPEQVLAPEAVDARADVFGAGAVLYELLTTRRVYQGRTTDEVLADVAAVGRGWRPITPVAVLAPDVPPSLAAATLALVAPSRDDRPATALAALALVEDALVLTPPVAPGAALVRAALAARFPTEAPRAVELAADALAPRAPDLAAVMSAETRTIDPAAVTAESLDRDDDR
jgi:serine/threonine-protein kinase